MDNMGERFKLIRKEMGLSQEAFGKRLKVTTSSISRIESGINNPSDRTIALVCTEFGINEEWLRTGNGPRTMTTSGSLLSQLQKKYDMSDLELRIIKSYLELPSESRKKFEEFIVALSEEQKEQAANLASELQPGTTAEKENDDTSNRSEEDVYAEYIKNTFDSAGSMGSSVSSISGVTNEKETEGNVS